MEGQVRLPRFHLLCLAAGFGLLLAGASQAQGPAPGKAGAGESQMTLRKSVQSREYQGKEIEGEERMVGRGDSLWRILIQEKGLSEKRFQSYLVVIRGLNPRLKNLNVLRVGDAIFIPLRPDEAAASRSAKGGAAEAARAPTPPGTTVNYRVKAGEYLYQILRDRTGIRDEKQLLDYYELTKDLNPQRKNWDLLREGEIIRLPAVAPAQEIAKSDAAAAPQAKPLAEVRPAQAAQTAQAAPPAQVASPALDAQSVRRLPATENMALLAQVMESLGAQLQTAGDEVVAVKDAAIRFDKSSYPVVYDPKIKQRVVIDPQGNIPASLRAQLNSPTVGAPVVSMNPKTSLHDAVGQLLAGLGYQSLPPDRPVIIQEAGVSYEAKGNWMALAPEENNKAQEIYVINFTDQAETTPDYLIAQLRSRGLNIKDVVVASAGSRPAAAVNESQVVNAQVQTWPRDKKELVNSLLLAHGIPAGGAATLSVKLRDGLTLETQADRVFEARGNKIALFFQRAQPEIKKSLQESQGYKTVELDIAALSSRDIIGRLLSELGEPAGYREHRFPAAGGSNQERLLVNAWGFLLPQRSLFVTDREIPQSLHRFFFEKGLEIVYFQ